MTNPYKVLIVEDEARWREDILREALEDQGYQVHTSSSYSEAIRALNQRPFDLAVIDVNLTGVSGNQDGLRVLEHLANRKKKDTVSIVISGSETRTVAAKRAKQFHAVAFVDKTTFDVVDFVSLVSKALP